MNATFHATTPAAVPRVDFGHGGRRLPWTSSSRCGSAVSLQQSASILVAVRVKERPIACSDLAADDPGARLRRWVLNDVHPDVDSLGYVELDTFLQFGRDLWCPVKLDRSVPEANRGGRPDRVRYIGDGYLSLTFHVVGRVASGATYQGQDSRHSH